MKKIVLMSLIALTSISLVGCSKNSNSTVKETKEIEESKVVKNKATDLPVEFYYKTGADINNLKTIVTRKVESVSWEKVNEENKIKFHELYPNYMTKEITNLEDNYQMLKIVISKENSFVEGFSPSEYDKEQLPKKGEFALSKKTNLVLGKENISSKYPFINSQISRISDSESMSSYKNNNGVLYIAIPIEIYKENKNNMQIEVYPSNEDTLGSPFYLNIK